MRCSRRLITVLVAVFLLLLLASEATAAHFGYRSLAKGMQGEDVEELQWMFRRLGYYTGPVDGIYGVEVEKSIKILQKTFKLPETGRLEGRMLEITTTLWAAFISGEFEASEVYPDYLESTSTEPQLLVYRVSRGDTISSIARKHGSAPSLLVRINNLANPNLIRPGQKLFVPIHR